MNPSDFKPARRVKATRKEWEMIRRAKLGQGCRVCGRTDNATLHHLCPVSRRAEGDDVAENLVQLCVLCHALIEARDETASMRLGLSLRREEIAYVLRKKGAYYLADRYRLAFTDDEAKEIAA